MKATSVSEKLELFQSKSKTNLIALQKLKKSKIKREQYIWNHILNRSEWLTIASKSGEVFVLCESRLCGKWILPWIEAKECSSGQNHSLQKEASLPASLLTVNLTLLWCNTNPLRVLIIPLPEVILRNRDMSNVYSKRCDQNVRSMMVCAWRWAFFI